MFDNLIQAVAARACIAEKRTDSTDVAIPEIGKPATSEDVLECERSLEFSLPELLRRLYVEIGNGGFGPGYGFFPIPTIETSRAPTLLSLYQELKRPAASPGWEWPTGLLMICDWGCLIRSCVDVLSPDLPIFTATEYGVHTSKRTLETWLSGWAAHVDLWEELVEEDADFAPHPMTGEPMAFA